MEPTPLNSAGAHVHPVTGERLSVNSTNSGAIRAFHTRAAQGQITVNGPIEGQVFSLHSQIILSATTLEAPIPGSRIDFYAGEQLIASTTNETHTAVWTNANSGVYSITAVLVAPDGTVVSSLPVSITVNSPPGLSPLADIFVITGAPPAQVAFAVQDLETAARDLLVTAHSSDTNLLPSTNLFVSGEETIRVLQLTPVPGRTGECLVTVTVDDGLATSSGVFRFVVTLPPPPIFAPVGDLTIDEGTLLELSLLATNRAPDQTNHTFIAQEPLPEGASLNPTNGLFRWQPGESVGPGLRLISIAARDVTGATAATLRFIITVREVNSAPRLGSIPNQLLHAGHPWSYQAIAEDDDLPANTLQFHLGTNTPPGLTIGRTSGLLEWDPPIGAATTNYLVTVFVVDNGVPALSAQREFQLTLLALPVMRVRVAGNQLQLSWTAIPGRTYRVQYKTSLSKPSWTNLSGDVTATGEEATKALGLEFGAQVFFRVQLLP